MSSPVTLGEDIFLLKNLFISKYTNSYFTHAHKVMMGPEKRDSKLRLYKVYLFI